MGFRFQTNPVQRLIHLLRRQSLPPLVSTTMPPLPNELWWDIIAYAISHRSDLAIVRPSSERLYPFFPAGFSSFSDPYFYSTQLAIWRRSNMIALNLMRVNRLWRGLAEPLLYSALYVEHEWQLQMFINNVEKNSKLAEQLSTLVIMPRSFFKGLPVPSRDRLIKQVLNLCHGVTTLAVESFVSSTVSLFPLPDSSRHLRLLSALRLRNEEFPTFVVNFNNYATLQVLELSVRGIEGSTLPSLPEHVLFPSLRTLILGHLDPISMSGVGKWELPSLKELSISRWNPLISTALIPLLQRSYERLEFLNANMDLLHDRAFYDITRAPPPHLRNLTLSIAISGHTSPPMHPAVKLVFRHVTTLGVSRIGMIRPENKVEWVRFFSESSYMPHLRSVLTDATTNLLDLYLRSDFFLLDILRSIEEVLEDRGVAFKGMTDDYSSFFSIKLLQSSGFEVSMPVSIISAPCSSPYSSSAAKCPPRKLSTCY